MINRNTVSFILLLFTLVMQLANAEPAPTETFAGLGFGVGLSVTIDSGGEKNRVGNAEIVDGIVRVTEENNTLARVLLESHYFFEPSTDKLYLGHGPFIALQPGSTETIDAIGMGWMIGLRKKASSGSYGNNSWNFGIGIIVDPNSKVLGDGLEKNQPTLEQQVRYKTESETGVLLFTSFGWR